MYRPKLSAFVRSEKIDKLSQFNQSDTTPIPLIIRTKGIKNIVPVGLSEGTWEFKTPGHSKYLSYPGTCALKALEHSCIEAPRHSKGT